jgi:two-component system, sensor histidine kinase
MNELAEITRHLLHSSPDALVVIDDRGKIRFANDTATEQFGYTAARLLGQSIEMLVPDGLRSQHGRCLREIFRNPCSPQMSAAIEDLSARRADGSEFAAGIRLAPFAIGDRLLVSAAIRDETERRHIDGALKVAREEALRSNRAKSRLLATASHDLRQPLQAIMLLNASMIRLAGQSEMGTLLRQQKLAIEATARLLSALLDISRLESGVIEPQCGPVSMPELFDDLSAEFATIARARGLSLELNAVRVAVHTDRALFHQLLQNVVGNAFKYTEKGSVTIDCSQCDGALRVRITDTGIGIPQDKLDRIFGEYYQVDTHGAKRIGLGLGLAIVKELARLLAFRITITSLLGWHTEVVVHIPAERVALLDGIHEPGRSVQHIGSQRIPAMVHTD